MSEVVDILSRFKRKGVVISADQSGENLSVKGNIKLLTADEKGELILQKANLLSFFEKQKSFNQKIEIVSDNEKSALSSNQLGIWMQIKLSDDHLTHWLPSMHDFQVPELNISTFSRALELLANEQKILSSIFFEENDQPFFKPSSIDIGEHFSFVDISAQSYDKSENESNAIIKECWESVDSVYDKPLWNCTLIKFSENRYKLFFKIHHLIADGTSLGLLRDTLLSVYEKLENGTNYRNDGIQYSDYTNWINDRSNFKSSSKFWKQYFSDFENEFYLEGAIDKEPGNETTSFDFKLSTDVKSKVDHFLAEKKVSLTHLFTLAFSIVVSKYSRSTDFVIGIPTEGRSHPQLQNLIGDLVNVVPLRIKLDYEKSVQETLDGITENFIEVLEHQMYQLDFLLTDLNYKSNQDKTPLFDLLLSFPNNEKLGLKSKDELDLSKDNSLYALSCTVLEFEDAISVYFEFDNKRFSTFYLKDFSKRLELVLTTICEGVKKPLSELTLVTQNEERKILDWGKAKPEMQLPYSSVIEQLHSQVLRNGKSIACVAERERYNYAELWKRTIQIADHLLSKNISENDNVLVDLPMSIDQIASMLAIWVIKAVYVPVNSDMPNARKVEIIEDCNAVFVIDGLTEFSDNSDGGFKFSYRGIGSANAYILYTSGSTGKPKGVVVSHRNLLSKMWEEKALFNVEKNISCTLTSAAFDVSFLETIFPLVFGGTVVVPSNKKDLNQVVNEIILNNVNILHGTPTYFSHFQQMLKNDQSEKLNNLIDYICIGGESLTASLVKDLHVVLPDVQINNHYGPTEATIHATVSENVKTFEKNIIGKPLKYTSAYILDSDYNVLPVGLCGELHIGGEAVSKGYYGETNLTEAAFTFNPKFKETIYATGDLARWQDDGNIQFIGRKDSQIKLRGYRIELEEINARLLEIADVRSACTIVIGYSIVSWVVGTAISVEGIQEILKKKVPHYMVPNTIQIIDKIPLKRNGKINESELIESYALQSPNVTLRNEFEERVGEIWKDLLRIDELSRNDNFFELGGHSLLMIRLQSRYKTEFSVSIGLKELFKNGSFLSHVEKISKGIPCEEDNPIISVADSESYPLSIAQKKLWVYRKFNEREFTYNMPFVTPIELEKPFSEEHFTKALSAEVERHEILRTAFREDANGEPRQYVLPKDQMHIPLEMIDLRDELNPLHSMNTLIEKDSMIPFDFEEGALFRVKVIRLSDNEYQCYYVMHHIISDGESIEVFAKDLHAFYNSYSFDESLELEPLEVQYRDYASWEVQNIELDKNIVSRTFWEDKLKSMPDEFDFPNKKKPSSLQNSRGKAFYLDLPYSYIDKLSAFDIKNGSTMFSASFALTALLLSKYTGQNKIVMGTPVSNRSQQLLAGQIGFYVNVLPVEVEIAEGDSFDSVNQTIRQNIAEVMQHQSYPIDSILESSSTKSTWFDVLFTFENNPIFSIPSNGSDTNEPVELGNVSLKYDFEITIKEWEGNSRLVVGFNPEVYDYHLVEQMVKHFNELLRKVLDAPQEKVWKLSCLTDQEKLLQLQEFSGINSVYQGKKTIVDAFNENVDRFPNNKAISLGDKTLTYLELDNASNKLAHYLIENNQISKGDRVAIDLDRSIELIITVLAIIKVGATYLPIDNSYPKERIDYFYEDCQVELTIDEKEWTSYSFFESQLSNSKVERSISDDDHVYIMYTSGSTGKPKGVPISHRNIVSLVKGTDYIDFNESLHILSTGALSFDATTFEFWGALLNGGELRLCSQNDLLNTPRLGEIIRDYEVNTMWFTAGWFDHLVDNNIEVLELLTTIIVGGDRLSPKQINALLSKNPTQRLVNGYGPTENTTFSLTHQIDEVNGSIPIGRPLKHRQVYVLGKHMEVLPLGAVGELYLGGAGLSEGYLNQPELTKEKFVSNPFIKGTKLYKSGDLGRWTRNGTIEFLGRSDNQVKIRGFRIELGEIERRISEFDFVKQAAVTVRKNDNGNTFMVAHVSNLSSAQLDDLKVGLRNKLPDYMIPKVFNLIDVLPLTENGKIDRKELSKVSVFLSEEITFDKPETDVQYQILEIWKLVLGVDQVGINNNFYDLGGSSILALKIVNEFRKVSGVSVHPSQVLKFPTIKDFSENLLSVHDFVKQREQVRFSASYQQKRIWDKIQTGYKVSDYNILKAFKLKGRSINEFKQALEKVVEKYDVLKGNFQFTDDELSIVVSERDELIDFVEYELNNTSSGNLQDYYDLESDYDFDLEKSPLVRLVGLKDGDENYVIFNIAHIIVDGWAVQLLSDQVYLNLFDLTNSELVQNNQYIDFVSWQKELIRKRSFEGYLTDWKERIGRGCLPSTLPSKPQDKTLSENFVSNKLTKIETQSILSLCRENNLNLNAVILWAIATVGSEKNDADYFTTNMVFNGRMTEDLQNTMGIVRTTMTCCFDIAPDTDVLSQIRSFNNQYLFYYSFQDCPLLLLEEEIENFRQFTGGFSIAISENTTEISKNDQVNSENEEDSIQEMTMRSNKQVLRNDISVFVKINRNEEIRFVCGFDTTKFEASATQKFLEDIVNLIRTNIMST